MEDSAKMFGKSESPRSPTRLQRQAPTALHLDRVPENLFSQESCNEVATTAIPLLSPLFVPPNPHSSLGEGEAFKFPASLPEKKGVQQPMDSQHPATTEHSNQMALLNMFQTKFVLVDRSQ